MAWRSREDVAGIAWLVEAERLERIYLRLPHHSHPRKSAAMHMGVRAARTHGARDAKYPHAHAIWAHFHTASTEQKPEDNTTDGTPPDEAALQ